MKLLLGLAICVMWLTAYYAATPRYYAATPRLEQLEFVSAHPVSIAFYLSSVAALGIGVYLYNRSRTE